MKRRATKVSSIVLACCAFAGVLSFARESRAYWFSSEETYDTPTGRTAGPLGATCYASDNGMCTPGDTIRYSVSALNLDNPNVTATPDNTQSWVVSSNDWAWCYISVTCHLGGGAQEFYTDEHVWNPSEGGAPVACHVDCGNHVADDIYVNVGVGIYPP
jgi:hypothetical protein